MNRVEPQSDNTRRIIVCGFLIRWPLGGVAWHYLQYLVGLHRMGHDVYYAEDSDDYASCYDLALQDMTEDPSFGAEFVTMALRRLGLSERWMYYDVHGGQWIGPAGSQAREIFATADVILNVSGVNPLRPWAQGIRHRVLIDTDPAFTQVKHLTNPRARDLASQHNAFFTFGENFDSPHGQMPSDGLPWRPTRQPVVLDLWPVTRGPTGGEFTTVMQWDSYEPVEHLGRQYGMKSASFPPFMPMPRLSQERFRLAAVRVPEREYARLAENGWSLDHSEERFPTPWDYRRYIQQSKAEFSVAKHGYVESRCGWFSERTACYLASGRPAIVQDTGFSEWLETGAGIIGFDTQKEALRAVTDVAERYDFHCAAARDLAATYFDATTVLGRLLDDLDSSSSNS